MCPMQAFIGQHFKRLLDSPLYTYKLRAHFPSINVLEQTTDAHYTTFVLTEGIKHWHLLKEVTLREIISFSPFLILAQAQKGERLLDKEHTKYQYKIPSSGSCVSSE